MKEYKIHDYVILGIRREESTKRSKLYNEPEVCRQYSNGGGKARLYFPILDWTKEDIAGFVKMRNIQCHPLYYDEKGEFHPERRLGCLCCPLQGKKRIEEFQKYPNMIKSYIRNGQAWMDAHPNAKTHERFKDAFELFVFTLFYKNKEDFYNDKNAGFGKNMDCKQFLEDKFKITF